jgi:hypothetical protein
MGRFKSTLADVRHGDGCGCVRCREFEKENAAALRHGSHSPAQIGPVARAQRRRFLRQAGLRAADLDGLGLALLDNWARAQAKVELLDRYFAAAGFLDAAGEPRPAAAGLSA